MCVRGAPKHDGRTSTQHGLVRAGCARPCAALDQLTYPPYCQPCSITASYPHATLQVLDYQNTSHTLLPLVASAYAVHFMGETTMGMYKQFDKDRYEQPGTDRRKASGCNMYEWFWQGKAQSRLFYMAVCKQFGKATWYGAAPGSVGCRKGCGQWSDTSAGLTTGMSIL